MAQRKLNDNEVQDLLHNMIGMLRSAQGKRWRAQTPHGETALRTAAKLLTISVAVLHIDTAKQLAKDQEAGFIPPGPLPDL